MNPVRRICARWRRARGGRQMPVIGITRFSLLFDERNYFAEMEGLSLDQRRARLFAPSRMEDRFRHFEALCLPSLLAQTDPRFRGLILYSTELPDPWGRACWTCWRRTSTCTRPRCGQTSGC